MSKSHFENELVDHYNYFGNSRYNPTGSFGRYYDQSVYSRDSKFLTPVEYKHMLIEQHRGNSLISADNKDDAGADITATTPSAVDSAISAAALEREDAEAKERAEAKREGVALPLPIRSKSEAEAKEIKEVKDMVAKLAAEEKTRIEKALATRTARKEIYELLNKYINKVGAKTGRYIDHADMDKLIKEYSTRKAKQAKEEKKQDPDKLIQIRRILEAAYPDSEKMVEIIENAGMSAPDVLETLGYMVTWKGLSMIVKKKNNDFADGDGDDNDEVFGFCN